LLESDINDVAKTPKIVKGETLKLKIESPEPIHWLTAATLGGRDLRNFIRLLFKPASFIMPFH